MVIDLSKELGSVWQPNSLVSPFLCPTQLVVEKLEHGVKLVSQFVPFYFPHAFSIRKYRKHGEGKHSL